MRKTMGDYLSPRPRSRPAEVQTLKEILEEEKEVSNLLETESDWTEEECQRTIQQRLREIRGRVLLVLPRKLTHEEWCLRLGLPAGGGVGPGSRA